MLIERFIKYAKINSQADPKSNLIPSSETQIEFLKILQQELIEMGLKEVEISNNCTLFASIEANHNSEKQSVIGLIAHVDTSYDVPAENINPIIHKYKGGDIKLPYSTITEKEYPELKDVIGHTIITSDGRTILGADDKAGVAILMELQNAIKQKNTIHHKIRLAFTTDEEIGRSIENFDIQKFGAKIAYTLDAGGKDLLEYENFNAASAKITICGKNIHPGYAFGKMVNACDIAVEFHRRVPNQKPENTQNREGFFLLHDMLANVEKAQLNYIIRDFNQKTFEQRKKILIEITDHLNAKYNNAISIEIVDSYLNMRKLIPENVIEKARKAYLYVGIKPNEKPIRGGTDGARLSQLGVPTPNLFNGGMNFHSKHEYCSIDTMKKALEMVVKLVSVD